MHCFIAEVECPSDTLAWLEGLEPYLDEDEHHTHRSALLAYRASLVNARMKQMLASKDVLQCFFYKDIVEDVEQIEYHIGADMACTAISSSISLATVNRHNYHRVFQMKLRSSLWELLKDTSHSPGLLLDSLSHELQSKRCEEIVLELSNEVLETIPTLLDANPPRTTAASGQIETSNMRPQKWHDAMSLMWPLRIVAYGVRLSSDDQKSAARAGLRRIASEYYIMHAINRQSLRRCSDR